MAATSTDLDKGSDYTSHGMTKRAEFDFVTKKVTLKNPDGTIVFADFGKHDLEHFFEIITKLKTDVDALFL